MSQLKANYTLNKEQISKSITLHGNCDRQRDISKMTPGEALQFFLHNSKIQSYVYDRFNRRKGKKYNHNDDKNQKFHHTNIIHIAQQSYN